MKEAPRPSKAHRFAEQLTSQQRAALKAKAHHLKPVIQVGGQGLSATVLAEMVRALNTHELIKLQLPGQTEASEKRSLSKNSRKRSQSTLLLFLELAER